MAIRCTWPLRRLRRPPRLRYRPLSAVPRGWWAEHLPRRSPVGGRRAKAARFDSLTSRAANWRRRSPHSVTWHPDSALCWPINWRSPNGRYTPHHHPATTNSHLIFFLGGGLSKSNRISFSHRKKTLLSGRNEISEIYRVKTFFLKIKLESNFIFPPSCSESARLQVDFSFTAQHWNLLEHNKFWGENRWNWSIFFCLFLQVKTWMQNRYFLLNFFFQLFTWTVSQI